MAAYESLHVRGDDFLSRISCLSNLWPWPWPWAHPGCTLTWSPSCASFVAIRPFACEKWLVSTNCTHCVHCVHLWQTDYNTSLPRAGEVTTDTSLARKHQTVSLWWVLLWVGSGRGVWSCVSPARRTTFWRLVPTRRCKTPRRVVDQLTFYVSVKRPTLPSRRSPPPVMRCAVAVFDWNLFSSNSDCMLSSVRDRYNFAAFLRFRCSANIFSSTKKLLDGLCF